MNKYQRTRDALLDAIYYREWQIGQALPTEPQLMVRFSVGRNTLREVIRSLTTEGIVEVIQGSGTYLRRMPGSAQATNLHQPLLPALPMLPLEDIGEVLILRRALEVQAAELAALHRSEEDMAHILHKAQVHYQACKTGSCTELLDTDLEFHRSIVEATHSKILIQLYQMIEKRIRDTIRPFLHLAYSAKGGFLHQALLDAIEQQNAERAVQVTREHFDYLFAYLAKQSAAPIIKGR
ncbi:hypothetical protein C4K68_14575 [Pokkaliibacter plantistimulans]|uniref:HTH gntR-type domain-containing protein n=1 Tax=Proteobacteria bacterium 228 TaxID=2083153 RepID=A0A2S5KP24_9PROT|nr:FCD domain-containing protein [Pokkaliibacter plantistimulans]PPC76594.1 hypothetical protein C4K68_14575 [Pokkaliibacter plantistimulans]